jgi:hypothetical protein
MCLENDHALSRDYIVGLDHAIPGQDVTVNNPFRRASCPPPRMDLADFDLGLNQYQERAYRTAVYPREVRVVYPALGLAGEAGELCEKLCAAMFPAGKPKDPLERLVWAALSGAAGAGKVAETVKKMLRGDVGAVGSLAGIEQRVNAVTAEQMAAIADELGDTLWYQGAAATDTGNSLADVADDNLDKLGMRAEAGTLRGDTEFRNGG